VGGHIEGVPTRPTGDETHGPVGVAPSAYWLNVAITLS